MKPSNTRTNTFFPLLMMTLLLMTGLTASCSKDPHDDGEAEKTLIFYSAGFNNLATPYFKDNLRDLFKGYIPSEKDKGNRIFYVSHEPETPGDYQTRTSPHVIRIYKDKKNAIIMDTLLTCPAGTSLLEKETMRSLLSYIDRNWKSRHYGMVFSSHATGWLPAMKYDEKKTSTFSDREISSNFYQDVLRPDHERELLPDVKSIGAEFLGSHKTRIEMDLKDFASAIPMHMDYIIFDACLMGGVETAYELKDVCDRLVFSQTQVLAQGMNYKKMTTRLLLERQPNTTAVAYDFYSQYEKQTGNMKSATISVVDCSGLERLAAVCKDLFGKYRSELPLIRRSAVQPMDNKPWFYDFKDILLHLGITEEEEKELDEALDGCVIYKAATERFIGLPIRKHSGLSMYLPCAVNFEEDDYYSDFQWDKATGYTGRP